MGRWSLMIDGLSYLKFILNATFYVILACVMVPAVTVMIEGPWRMAIRMTNWIFELSSSFGLNPPVMTFTLLLSWVIKQHGSQSRIIMQIYYKDASVQNGLSIRNLQTLSLPLATRCRFLRPVEPSKLMVYLTTPTWVRGAIVFCRGINSGSCAWPRSVTNCLVWWCVINVGGFASYISLKDRHWFLVFYCAQFIRRTKSFFQASCWVWNQANVQTRRLTLAICYYLNRWCSCLYQTLWQLVALAAIFTALVWMPPIQYQQFNSGY